MSRFVFKGKFTKTDVRKKVAYGWAYVTDENNVECTDHSGDVCDIDEIVKGAHDFVANSRVGGEMHVTKGGAELVESLVFTKTIQEALGIDLKKQGWFVGFRINDDSLLEKIEKGEYQMFSIGGSGKREAIDAEEK